MSNKTVIIGGVAGGATTAARLRRRDEEMQIVLFEKGEHISYANCGLPYYVGDVIKERENLLLQTPEAMMKKFKIDVRIFRSEERRVGKEGARTWRGRWGPRYIKKKKTSKRNGYRTETKRRAGRSIMGA